MRLNLLPREEKFQEIFSRASKNTVEAAKTFKSDIKNWQFSIEKIHDLEREGDLIRHELIDKLNHTFITPMDREDIYKLSGELDDVVDLIQACADRMIIYNMKKPKDDGLMCLAEIAEHCTVEIDRAITDMQDEKKKRRVHDHCIEINRLENEGDNLTRKLLRDLFANAASTPPLETMIWKEIYEFIESLIDKCENVANTIESIVVKNY